MNENEDGGFEVEASLTFIGSGGGGGGLVEEDEKDIEQLPQQDDESTMNNESTIAASSYISRGYSYVASNMKWVIVVMAASFAVFFSIGIGLGYGIGDIIYGNKDDAPSVSSAMAVDFTASDHGGKSGKSDGGAKSGKSKSDKSSGAKSGKATQPPTSSPSSSPTRAPSLSPSGSPTKEPSKTPSRAPSGSPTGPLCSSTSGTSVVYNTRNLTSQRRIQAELTEEVVWPGSGGFCPSLPANRNPADSTGATNNGWTLVGNPYTDDGSTNAPLPFTFDLLGTSYSNAFINNNGNLSFGQGYPDFTASGFPVEDFPPFWADVDTRGDGALGRVWQQTIGSNKFAVAWDHVGYFDRQGDKRNTFMVLISDGTDVDMGLGNNVCFCYEDMEWTTGDFSGGVDGFGGTPATAGINEGSGDLDYFQIGRYDEVGSATSTGIDNLDGQSYCFNVAIELPENCV